MRKLFLTGALCVGMFFSNAQNAQPSAKVLSAFDNATIKSFDNEQLEYWNFYGNEGFVVHEEMKAGMKAELLSSIRKSNKVAVDGKAITQESFNPFDYDFTPNATEVTLFLVDGTNKIIQFNSQLMLDKDFGYYMKGRKKQTSKVQGK